MAARSEPFAPVGRSGLAQFGGMIVEEWDRRLRGRRGPETWREMAEGSPVIGAALRAWESLVLATGYRVEPADDTPEAAEIATFCAGCLEDMEGPFAETLSEVFTYRVFGFALLEFVYKRRRGPSDDPARDSAYDDGRIGWRRWSPRAQETILRWEFAGGDPVAAVQQTLDGPPATIPLDRCLHVAARRRKQNPEGLSLLRNAFEPWYYFKHIQRVEAIGIERDLAGLPVVKVPIDVYDDPARRAPWERLASDLRRDEQAGLVLPQAFDPTTNNELYTVSLLSTGGQRQVNTDEVLARYERLMLRSLLVDWLALGDTGTGSYAQSVNRVDVFLRSVRGELALVEDAITVQAFRRLLKLNGMPLELTPRFAFNDLTKRDAQAFAQAIVALAGAGLVLPDAEVRRVVYEVLGLPYLETGGAEPVAASEAAPVHPRSDQAMLAAEAPPPRLPERATVTEDDLDAAAAWMARVLREARA